MSQFREKWAILIGPTEYQFVKKLKYCAKDILSVAKVLKESLAFQDDHIFTFGTDLQYKPTLEDIYHQLGVLKDSQRIGPDDLLLFYFSGHGFKDKKDYLLPVSATPKALGKTAIEVEELVTDLVSTKCKNVVMFIDACREQISGAKGAVSVGAQSRDILEREGIVTFFSCDPTDLSYEIDELGHGSFTFCFLEAIQDGKCETAQELYDFLLQQLPPTNNKYNKPLQKPYAVIQGADKWKLPIFEGNVYALASMQQRLNFLGNLFATGSIEEKYLEAAVELIEGNKGKRASGDEAKKLALIDSLCAGRMKAPTFRVAWDAVERLRIQGSGGPSIKLGLEPLR